MIAPIAQVNRIAPSPCTGICLLDTTSGRCISCGRTLDEIARWGSATEAERRAILTRIERSGPDFDATAGAG